MLRRVLIAGPDAARARGWSAALPEGEFMIRAEPSAEEALACVASFRPDCLLVSGEIGRLPAAEVCRGVKAQARAPILVIAARREQAAINRALAAGADDVMVEPCHPAELLWRVRGLLRRYEAPAPAPASDMLRVGPFEVDASQGVARVKGRPLALTKTELGLLELFLRNPARVLNRRFLLENVWGFDRSVGSRVVDLGVFQLRKKLGARWGKCLQTRRSFGYCLEL